MSPQKEVASGLPQLGVRILADSNRWNVRPQNCETDAQEYWASLLWQCPCTAFLSYFFRLVYEEPNFKYQIFCFQVYGDMLEENIMYQQVQKICR